MNFKTIITSVALSALAFSATAAEPLWQGKGRIAISSDGNEHDDDDWAATPLTLALLASEGLQDKMVLYTYSDHIWGSNIEIPERAGMTPYDHMRESALGAKERFGFDNSQFICAVDNAEVAIRAMRDAINASSEENPLIIIAAGPMEVVGEALNRSEFHKRKYITVLSHSWWNDNHSDHPYIKNDAEKLWWDNHSGWTFKEMREEFEGADGGAVKFVSIKDQNGGEGYDGFQAHRDQFEWLLSSGAREKSEFGAEAWDWLYGRMAVCPKGDLFDPSDAGMVIYLLRGIEETEPYMAREIMERAE